MTIINKSSQRQCGAYYEHIARRYLEQHGLCFIAANVTVRGGELDLIMRDQDDWIFVEVRYRRSNHYGSAVESITTKKQQRLHHAAATWFHQRGLSIDTQYCRFDIVAIDGPDETINWYRNTLQHQ
ncbi:MAG: YraN family protein [Plesiomonas sp.]|uniref:YraN family protein n=1 Tax=Plesiomonas sp. TaxID=2486279 RepID=UPI003F3ECB08